MRGASIGKGWVRLSDPGQGQAGLNSLGWVGVVWGWTGLGR